MKRWLVFCIFLAGCQTTVYRNGKPVFRTQADATNVTYIGNGVSFHADTLNHSVPTLAGGRAFAHGVSSVGVAASGIGAAFGGGGLAPVIAKSAVVAVPSTISASQSPAK